MFFFTINLTKTHFFLRYLFHYSIKCLNFFLFHVNNSSSKMQIYQVNIFIQFFFCNNIILFIYVCMCVANTIFFLIRWKWTVLFGTTICLNSFCVGILSKTFFFYFSMYLTKYERKPIVFSHQFFSKKKVRRFTHLKSDQFY